MQPFFGDQPSSYWHFVKSIEGVTGIIIVILMAIAFTLATPWFRRNRLNLPPFLKKLTGFNAFWYSHHLFIIVYALLIVHGHFLYLTDKWHKKTVSNFANQLVSFCLRKKISVHYLIGNYLDLPCVFTDMDVFGYSYNLVCE